MREVRYQTPHGINVSRVTSKLPYRKGFGRFLRELDEYRGIYLSSGYEYPGRYSRWDIVSVRPPLELVSFQRDVTFRPLNERGAAINRMLATVLRDHPHWDDFREENGTLHGTLKPMPKLFPEEERSRQPSVFSILRALTREFRSEHDDKLAFAGAFGYDLLFQFEPIPLRLPRETPQRSAALPLRRHHLHGSQARADRALHLRIRAGRRLHARPRAHRRDDRSARRSASPAPSPPTTRRKSTWRTWKSCAKACAAAITTKWFCAQTFRTPYSGKASDLFERMQRANPSPYEFLIQFGDEQLVGASPEMFVRVEGERVETCPIAGTARRTGDPLQDEKNIRALLNSTKEESELTMCTDVDRNDKSRVCEPGTVKVIGRRLIEAYAGLVPYGGSRRRLSAGRLRFARRLPEPYVGRHADRRAEKSGGDRDRKPGEECARLVRRRGRHAVAQRRYQYRHPDSHHLSARRLRRPTRRARRCSTIPIPRPKSGNAAQGHRLLPPAGPAGQLRPRRRRARAAEDEAAARR